MLSRHIASLLVCSLLVTAVFAAEVKLGPERLLARDLEVGPAAYTQTQPSVASNGRDFLAVWIDQRYSYANSPLFASRLSISGHPFEPLGRKVAEVAEEPHVASAGGDYLIAWHDKDGSKVLRVDENGRALGDVRRLSSIREPRELVSNGSTYLLMEARRDGTTTPPHTATILDRDGATLKTIDVLYGKLLWAGAYDGRYVVIDIQKRCDPACMEEPTLHTIAETAQGWVETSRVFLPYVEDPLIYWVAAASPDRIVVTSHKHFPGAAGTYMIFDYDGNVVKDATPLPGPIFLSGAAWDGRDFLVLFGLEQIFALRVSPDGATYGKPFVLSSFPDFASNGSQQLLVWAGRHFSTHHPDIVARAVAGFAELASTPEQETLVSYSGAAQFDVQVAWSPAGLLGVWKDSNGAIKGVVNDTPFTMTLAPENLSTVFSPAVAAGATNFLVVWYETGDFHGWSLQARRVGFDGQVLDDAPILLAAGRFGSFVDTPGIDHDGSQFLVAFATGGVVHLARVTDDGELLERGTLGSNTASRWPDAIWSGRQFLVPHALRPVNPGCDICPTRWAIAVDGTPVFENAAIGGSDIQFAAAAGPDRVTLAWFVTMGTFSTIHVAQITPDGARLAGPFRLRDVPALWHDSLELAWNGSEYVLAWTEPSGMIRAMRLTSSASPIDSEPFDVATQSRRELPRFSMTPTAAGVAFGYDHVDEGSGNVSRAFTRTLDRLTSAPPRRAVRH